MPAGDQTLLFTNTGMVQFKDVLAGPRHARTRRAVDDQRCLRVAGKHNDFEEVGRTPRHHTLFEMLGNWSFGDYFKREAIHWAWEFLTDDLGIPADRLAATTYTDDEEAWAIWRDEIGLPPERMARWGDVDAGDDHNFWRMADTGPCGPCSEIHYDRGAHLSEGPDCVPDHSENCPRWLELWNLVFMEFDQRPDGRVPLPFKSVDTGHGPRAPGLGAPGRPLELRHGPVHADPRADAGAARPRPGRLRGGALQLPGHRRPLPSDRRSSSPTACCPRTRAAATSCGGSSAARSATAGCSVGASRSWPRPRASSSTSWATRTRTSSERRDAILAAITREEPSSRGRSTRAPPSSRRRCVR